MIYHRYCCHTSGVSVGDSVIHVSTWAIQNAWILLTSNHHQPGHRKIYPINRRWISLIVIRKIPPPPSPKTNKHGNGKSTMWVHVFPYINPKIQHLQPLTGGDWQNIMSENIRKYVSDAPLYDLSLMLTAPFCSRGLGVNFRYLNTEPHKVFGALWYIYRDLSISCRKTSYR